MHFAAHVFKAIGFKTMETKVLVAEQVRFASCGEVNEVIQEPDSTATPAITWFNPPTRLPSQTGHNLPQGD